MAEKIPNKGLQKSIVSSVPVKEIHGITYFKLQSDYPGDYTKNCGLLGNEIDENFYFLRSNDIETGYTEEIEGKKYLVLVKLDDEEIRIDITDAHDINFKVEDGYIYAIYPDGREVPFGEGGDPERPVKFLVEGEDVHVVTDSSIDGDGSYENPIGIDLASKTGTYAPADFFVDFTCGDKSLKDYEDIGYSHAIVTKENASRFGALYTYGQAEKINEALAGSGWRLPSESDWAKLLNGAEIIEEAKEHDTMMCGNFGCVAGNRLKSIDFWREGAASEPTDDFGLNIYPVGVYAEVNNTMEPAVSGFSGLYEVTSFWEADEANGEGYARTFSYGHDDVAQFTESKASKRSIRLVRDVEDGFDVPEFAVILDNFVPVKYVPESKQVWTSVNIGFTNYDGYKKNQVVVPEEWAEVESYDGDLNIINETKFYYNAWDGKQWHKKLMKQGESVVLLYEDPEEPCDTASTAYVTSANTNHEWRIFFNEETNNDELIDTLEALKAEFQEELDEINEKIDELSATTEEFSAATAEEIARIDEAIDSIEIVSATPNSTTVLMSYMLNVNGEQRGITIDIPKDRAIKEISLGHIGAEVDENTGEITDGPEENPEALLIVYHNEEGKYVLVEINLEDFIQENEFASGVTVTDHIVHGVVDPESEDFLTVGGDGFKLSGVLAAIDEKVAEEQARAMSAETELNEEIVAEAERAMSAETGLHEEILDEMSARTEADKYLQEQIDEIKAGSIEPLDESIVIVVSGNTTSIGVVIDPEDEHLKLGENGLWIDPDFGEFGE